METYDHITYEPRDGHVGIIRMDPPGRLYPLPIAGVEALHACLDRRERDADCRVLVLTGTDEAFCAGADLKEQQAIAREQPDLYAHMQWFYRYQKRNANLALRLRQIPQPVIAAVRGVATGLGFFLATAADIRVAGDSARFGVAVIKLGLTGGDMGSSYLLPRLIGLSRAAELLYSGDLFDAAEAERIGYVSHRVPDGEVLDRALAIARNLARRGAFGLMLTKDMINAAIGDVGMDAAFEMENRSQALCVGDFEKGMEAFLAKRPPEF